jgi:hypothetical protein
MQEIITAIKRDTGIDVVYQKGKETKGAFFSYSDLIDLRINALDVLDYPGMYLIDADHHKIEMSPAKSAKK